MHTIEVETGFSPISFYGENLHLGADYFIKANCPLDSVKLVLFFDSRGISGPWENSLLKKLLDYFQETNCLAVSRPLELTTWATLYNFFRLNDLRPDLLITNVGIVDYTPKKYSLCEVMRAQVRFTSETDETELQRLENWVLSNGECETLFTVNYSESYAKRVKSYFGSIPIVSIKTPLVDPSIQIERSRPPSFFTQLYKTNKFIDWLGCKAIDLGLFDRQLTYDAVHWTHEGNRFVFEEIIRHLRENRHQYSL